MSNYWAKRRSLRKSPFGVTLLELAVASGVFATAFAGALVGQQVARNQSENALVSYIVMTRAQGIIEAIQSYEYESAYYTSASQAFGYHSNTYGSFDSNHSGVYSSSGVLLSKLPEQSISLRTYQSEVNSSHTALDPFSLTGTLSDNNALIGPEDEDKHSDSQPSTGLFKILDTQQRMNIFSSAGVGQEKYFFMDDCDDFDGYVESVEIIPNVVATFSVSVCGIFSNYDNYNYTIENVDGSDVANIVWTQVRLAPMDSVNLTDIYSDFAQLSSSDDTTAQAQKLGYGYYQSTLFKKITVKVEYEFPPGSGRNKVLVFDGGKVNPNGSAL